MMSPLERNDNSNSHGALKKKTALRSQSRKILLNCKPGGAQHSELTATSCPSLRHATQSPRSEDTGKVPLTICRFAAGT